MLRSCLLLSDIVAPGGVVGELAGSGCLAMGPPFAVPLSWVSDEAFHTAATESCVSRETALIETLSFRVHENGLLVRSVCKSTLAGLPDAVNVESTNITKWFAEVLSLSLSLLLLLLPSLLWPLWPL